MPAFVGFANWMIPLMIGASDMAFARMNNWSFWLLPPAAILLVSSLLVPGGAAAAGWTLYPPLSVQMGIGMDMAIFAIHILGISSIMGSINIVTTLLNMRAPGMTLMKMPLFCWTWLITAYLVIAVMPVLAGAGFQKLRLYGPQEKPDGDFPNVPGHVANPENPAVLSGPIEEASARGDDLVMASDPDCDRLGAAAPLTRQPGSGWQTFTGNQIGALLTDWVLASRRSRGVLEPTDHVITTLVTTGLIRRIAAAYHATTVDTLQVGFKWIGQAIDQTGPEHFVFGCEESHGYLAGTHVRDKDASVAALLLAELTASLKKVGHTLHQKLDELFCTHGCHVERQIAITLPGASGMERMKEIMATLRAEPPVKLGGLDVVRTRDYANLTTATPGTTAVPFAGAKGDLVIFDLAGLSDSGSGAPGHFPPLGNAVAARPSGTEPKIKFYLFAVAPPCSCAELPAVKQALAARLDALEHDLRRLAGV
jgi:phosphoglucomutase/phosphomannomutase